MAIHFTATAWRDWLGQFARTAKQVHLAHPDGTEFSGGGYQPLGLAGGSWTLTERGAVLVASYPEVKWVFTGEAPGAVGGYYVTNAAGQILWDEQFGDDPAFTVRRAGDWFAVSVVVDLDLEG